jgi:urease accessory protein
MAIGTESSAWAGVAESAALLRLMQLVSPALPIGAYAYSHALEWAAEAQWIKTEAQAEEWIRGLLLHAWARLDVPVLRRLMNAGDDEEQIKAWTDLLHTSRESAELQAEDRFMGQALARLLTDLGVPGLGQWAAAPRSSFPPVWARAALHWGIPLVPAASGLLWTYAEHQVSAAVKLVPLGQTAGQRMLLRLADAIPEAVRTGVAVADDEIGSLAPGLGIASALHETQYTRLFRS